MGFMSNQQFAGGCTKTPKEAPEDEPLPLHGAGICKWFNVHMWFGFLTMTACAGTPQWTSLCEPLEFTFKKSAKDLESIRVTRPGGVFCIGSESRPKGKNMQKRRSEGDRCYNSGGLDHHAKESKPPPQPKKCHFCQSISYLVALCPLKAQQAPSTQGKPTYFLEEEEIHSPALLLEAQN
uniref:Lin-28A-like second zinc knuckle domain-containing protein n=1 Tax=Aotus nancymaae TaxID=37293 RepID=A0A2K5CM32_AOTNA